MKNILLTSIQRQRLGKSLDRLIYFLFRNYWLLFIWILVVFFIGFIVGSVMTASYMAQEIEAQFLCVPR